MSNVVYEDIHYNEDIKKQFIDQYAAGTQKILSRLFKISQIVENELGKDLYEFNRQEIRRLGFLFMPKTTYASKANITWISKYIDWAIEEGFLRGINPLETVQTDWKEQFAGRTLKKYWTLAELQSLYTKLQNYQDIVLCSLLFNGVRGTGNSEILNLTIHDVDEKNSQLHVKDVDGATRWVTVHDSCIEHCKKAYQETEYEKMNGHASKDIKAPRAQLIDNAYVIRSANTNTKNLDEADKNIIHRRLSKIANEIDEPNFIPLNLYYSGMLYLASELYRTTGTLGYEEYEIIFSEKRFNEPSDQSRARIKAEFLNVEIVKELYDLD